MSKNVIGGVVAIALVLVVGLVSLQLFNKDDKPDESALGGSATEVATLLKDIPQNGAVLGNPDAPVTIVEFVDFKCPVCAAASEDLVPKIIDRYVKPGDAKLELRPILLGAEANQGTSVLGADSEIGALGALAIADQNLMWNYAEVLFRNQGNENDSWLNRDLVRSVVGAVGADTAKWDTEYDGNGVVERLLANNDAATAAQYQGTPHFQVTGPGGSQNAEYTGGIEPITEAVDKVATKK
ncbi:MAG: thioredoxin domain-containing protein [Actinobacteria bacterium]|nr:thioredoxin domain-containing protein [Thermoleophilia bacterium]MCB9011414.1 thioredoxin domain-containing protein [Actinomycetota bacterium]